MVLCDMKALNPTEAAPDPLDGVEGERIDHSFRIFPTVRSRKFNEMEFAVPAERGPECFREIWTLMRTRYREIDTWPIEYRTQAADEIFLSPAMAAPQSLFRSIRAPTTPTRPSSATPRRSSAIIKGRPHWGKLHYFTVRDLANAYPCWDRFREVRERMDPKGRFFSTTTCVGCFSLSSIPAPRAHYSHACATSPP